MFNLFKRQSPIERLQRNYEKLMKEAHALSISNRTASDAKYGEADAIGKEIDRLRASQT